MDTHTASFIETDGEMIRTFRYNPATSVEFKTAKQDVKVLDTYLFGRTLFIDGVLQSSLKDEDIYHRILVHPTLGHKRDAKTVCILGGGEGATAREVLKYKDIESVVMIDWDKELVEYFREKEPSWHKGALFDSRLTLEHSDIFEIIDEPRKYDILIVDLVDPDFECDLWRELFQKLPRWLNDKGSLVVNTGGVFPWEYSVPSQCETLFKEALEGKKYSMYKYKTFVPSFGREWSFVQVRLV